MDSTTMLLILVLVTTTSAISFNNISITRQLRAVDKPHLYIAGFFPMSLNSSKWRVGLGVLPAVKQALHDINKNGSVLPDYQLSIQYNDTKCDTGHGMKAFFDMMHRPPLKVLLFGDVCTSVTDPIAKASKRWNIVQLSYGDTHPMYSKTNFPNLFRIVPSENEFNAPRIELMKLYNWTKVGTLYQNQPLYSLAHNSLVKDLEAIGIIVKEQQSFADEVGSAVRRLQANDYRIILGNFNETWARKVFCEAFNAKMYGRRYQWLIVAAYDPTWWRIPDTNCSLDDIETALQGALLMDVLPLSTSDEVTISGKTPSEYNYIYDVVSMEQRSRFHGYAYDGIWALALALHNASNYYKGGTKKNFLSTFQYHDVLWEEALLESLAATSFMGVTGPVRFHDNGRKGSVLIKQFQAYNTVKTEVPVGQYDSVTRIMNLTKYPNRIMWNWKFPPKDRTIQISEHFRVNITVFTGFALVSSIGIVIAGFFLAVNIRFRNQRYIKMSSPYLNNLIIIGCIFTYTSVIILGLDSKLTSVEAFPYVCTARAWVLMAGFTLSFGAMFSKTWRVHSIFTNVKLNKKVIKDMQLFIVVGILLAIDFAIMITWQLLDPFYRETKNMTKYPDPTNDDVEIIPEIEYCKSNYMTIFVGCIYAYKGLLMMFGCFLAWETRHVSIPALNDSKYIGMSVYNSVMMCIIGAPLSHVLSEKQDVSFVIISIFIIFCTTATLCLVFLPKVIELKRNPKGTIEKRLRPTIKPTLSGTRRPSAASLYEHELRSAKGVNGKYRKQIREIDSEIQALAKILGDEAKEILQDAMYLAIPKSEILKKEDTDISSLYSLNSDGGEVYVDEEEEEKTPKKKLKYPGLAALALPHPPVPWVTTAANTAAKTIMFSDLKQCTEEPIHIETKPIGGESLLDLYTSLRSSSIQEENETEVEEKKIWNIAKEDKYVENNLAGSRVRLKSPTGRFTGLKLSEFGEEIFFEGPSHPLSSSTSHLNKESHLSTVRSISTTQINNLAKHRSYSVPRRLDGSLFSSEINLDVSLLPIFHKILVERSRSLKKPDKKVGASCPNIMIKCDIVEYL